MKPNKKEERRKAIARIALRYLSKRSIFLAVVYYRFFRYVVNKVWKRRKRNVRNAQNTSVPAAAHGSKSKR